MLFDVLAFPFFTGHTLHSFLLVLVFVRYLFVLNLIASASSRQTSWDGGSLALLRAQFSVVESTWTFIPLSK